MILISVLFNTVYYSIKKATLETELNSMRYLVQTVFCGNKSCQTCHTITRANQKRTAASEKNPPIRRFFSFKNGSEGDMLFEYINIIFMLPFISYHYVVTLLARYNQQAIALWELLGKLEIACAIPLSVPICRSLVSPEFKRNGQRKRDLSSPSD